MQKLLIIPMLALTMMLGGCVDNTEQAGKYNGYEIPPYEVVKAEGAFELRQYKPHIVAEVTVSGERDEALSAGFRLLAGYIFGKNAPNSNISMTAPVTQSKASEKIAMTAPVTQAASDQGWVVQFTMPSEYTLATLPKPLDEKVKLREEKGQKRAVIRFSGRTTPERLVEHEQKLTTALETHKLQAFGAVTHAYYNDPWTFPWNRRNEVMVQVK